MRFQVCAAFKCIEVTVVVASGALQSAWQSGPWGVTVRFSFGGRWKDVQLQISKNFFSSSLLASPYVLTGVTRGSSRNMTWIRAINCGQNCHMISNRQEFRLKTSCCLLSTVPRFFPFSPFAPQFSRPRIWRIRPSSSASEQLSGRHPRTDMWNTSSSNSHSSHSNRTSSSDSRTAAGGTSLSKSSGTKSNRTGSSSRIHSSLPPPTARMLRKPQAVQDSWYAKRNVFATRCDCAILPKKLRRRPLPDGQCHVALRLSRNPFTPTHQRNLKVPYSTYIRNSYIRFALTITKTIKQECIAPCIQPAAKNALTTMKKSKIKGELSLEMWLKGAWARTTHMPFVTSQKSCCVIYPTLSGSAACRWSREELSLIPGGVHWQDRDTNDCCLQQRSESCRMCDLWPALFTLFQTVYNKSLQHHCLNYCFTLVH